MAEAPEPSTRRMQVAIAALSVGLVVALVFTFVQAELPEWKQVQRRYNRLAAAAGKPAIQLRIRQTWKPALGVVDRCTSCHLAMGGAEPLAGDKLFADHPPIPHDPKELGCTVCHGGDGRGTSAEAGHGLRAGAQPLVIALGYQAGCGSCHTGLRTPSALLAAEGERLFREYECQACHTGKQSLASAGLRGFADDWHDQHLGRLTGPIAFAPLADEDLPKMAEFLRTLVGAPKLMAGKRLVAERGCRGCHRIGGVGGEDGPELTQEGLELNEPHELLAAKGLSGGAAQLAWHKAHLLDPPGTVKDGRMPNLGLTGAEAELLAGYVLSLRPRDLPEQSIPHDRLRAGRFGERDFATDGASLYAAFCSACHGAKGEGRQAAEVRLKSDVLGPVPSLTNPDFLALAEDPFLIRTISEGRPGRRMQAWGSLAAGLRGPEIKALVGYLRSFEPAAASFEAVMAATPDLAEGRATFETSCAPCHGPEGAGSRIGPPLAASDNVVTIDDNRIYGTLTTGIAGTAMGPFRRLDAGRLRSVIAFVRGLPRLPISRPAWKLVPGDAARGEPLFAQHCVKCHGKAGEGDKGPALANPAFVAAAGEGYLAGTIIRGRAGTKMPAFGAVGPENAKLADAEVSDLVAFLRSKQVAERPPSADGGQWR